MNRPRPANDDYQVLSEMELLAMIESLSAGVWKGHDMSGVDHNKIQGVDYELVSLEPLVGFLILDTDEGEIRVAINRMVAAMIVERMGRFLTEEPEAPSQALA